MPVPSEWLTFLRKQFPAGSRIQLQETKDPHSAGTLDHIDDAGIFHVKRENGEMLDLVLGENKFSILPPETHLLSLYMPLSADYYSRGAEGELSSEGVPLDGRDLVDFESEIFIAMDGNTTQEEQERGIMCRYPRQDGVNDKVRSVTFTTDPCDGWLSGVAECQVIGELLPEELDALKKYVTEQVSGTWGNRLEQKPIPAVDNGEVHVHLWSSDQDWKIEAEDEMVEPDLCGGSPSLCFSIDQDNGQYMSIKRGESGHTISTGTLGDSASSLRDSMTVGKNIRYYRKMRGLTQRSLGKMVGLYDSQIGSYERGENTPRRTTLERIASALGVASEYLMADIAQRNSNNNMGMKGM